MKLKLLLTGIPVLIAAMAMMSCQPKPTSGVGMHLPEGDVERGKDAFVSLKCNRCHIVTGVEIAKYEGGWDPPLELGGVTIRVKTYGDLVTAIANPDHIISQKYKDQLPAGGVSPMPSLIEEMTVGQLIDLVTMLHSTYKELQPDYTYEPYFF